MRILMFFIFLISMIACSEKKQVALQSYPDPYMDSFRNRHIKEVIFEFRNYPDTVKHSLVWIKIDSIKNVIREGKIGPILYVYDSLNFCVAEYHDYDENYSIDYVFKDKNTLLQKWSLLIGGSFYPDSVIIDRFLRNVVMKLDKYGRVVSVIDSLRLNKEFIYQNDKLILEKTNWVSSSDYLERRFEYESNLLSKIIVKSFEQGDSSKRILNFKDGLLSFIEGGEGNRINVKYIYYQK